jgi:uncharacterized protein YkwD
MTALVVALGSLLVAAPTAGIAAPATTQPADRVSTAGPTAAQKRQRILRDTNRARVARGLRPLRLHPGLNRLASRWATHMARTGRLEHNPRFASQTPGRWTRAGENIAVGYRFVRVTREWMASPGHRANILGDYSHIGIGVVVDRRGRPWYVQSFAKY